MNCCWFREQHVGAQSYVAFEARILTHNMTRGRSLIVPRVEIGDGSIVGAGSVVPKSVPPGSLVAGNPARILREGIEVGPFGRFLTADATESALAEAGLT